MEPLEHSSSWLMGYFQYSTYTQCISMRRRQQSGRYSAPALPTTTAPPQNVPLSPLMRLVAPRVAAAALDGGRSWWMGRRMVHHRQRQKWARITGPKLSAQKTEVPSRPLYLRLTYVLFLENSGTNHLSKVGMSSHVVECREYSPTLRRRSLRNGLLNDLKYWSLLRSTDVLNNDNNHIK